MKSLFLAVILTLVFGGLIETNAQQQAQKINVSFGKQKKAARSKITIKFAELVEDARCAEGAQCVWAGNATIKVTVSKPGSAPVTFEANTNTGAKGNVYEGYAINLTNLTPVPSMTARFSQSAYQATFSISRLSR